MKLISKLILKVIGSENVADDVIKNTTNILPKLVELNRRGNRKNAERSGKAVEWNEDTRKAVLVRVCADSPCARARVLAFSKMFACAVSIEWVDRGGRSRGSIE